MKILLILADDDCVFRALIRELFNGHSEFELIGEAGDGREAIAMTLQLHPDVVLMDLSMPVLNGVDATRSILASRPQTCVIGLSIHADATFEAEMLAAGARNYIRKEHAVRDLLPELRAQTRANESTPAIRSGGTADEF